MNPMNRMKSIFFGQRARRIMMLCLGLLAAATLCLASWQTHANAAGTSFDNCWDPGEPLRIGYLAGRDYGGSIAELVKRIGLCLAEEGSIDEAFVDKYAEVDFEASYSPGEIQTLWNDLCAYRTDNARFVFVRDAFFDMSMMDENDYPSIVNRDDVDMIFAMGTAAGEFLRDYEERNKYMVMYAADPISSGIVKSENERFKDNAFALIDETAYKRQIEAGYKFLQFRKLGIVCENSETAYLYSAIDVVKQASEDLGFDLMIEHVDEPVEEADYESYYENIKAAYRKLIDAGVDTIYITASSIDYEDKLRELLDDYIIPHHVKTLAQDESLPVQYGALFGMSQADNEELAYHVTNELRKFVIDGVPFHELDMVCECTPRLFVNYTTANEIGFQIPFEDLQVVDTIYR